MPQKSFKPKVFLRIEDFSEKLSLSQNHINLKGVMSHNNLYYQQRSIACYQVN